MIRRGRKSSRPAGGAVTLGRIAGRAGFRQLLAARKAARVVRAGSRLADDRTMRALSIRQPYAELIPSTYSGQALRGIKTVEYRREPTRIIEENRLSCLTP